MYLLKLVPALLSFVSLLPAHGAASPMPGKFPRIPEQYDETYVEKIMSVIEHGLPRLNEFAEKYSAWDEAKQEYVPKKPVLPSADTYISDHHAMSSIDKSVAHCYNRLQEQMGFYIFKLPRDQRDKDPKLMEMERIRQMAKKWNSGSAIEMMLLDSNNLDAYISEETFTNEVETQIEKFGMAKWEQKLTLDSVLLDEDPDKMLNRDYSIRQAIQKKRMLALQNYKARHGLN